MDTETDIFASSSLFTSFETSFTTRSSRRSESVEDDSSDNGNKQTDQLNEDLDADSNCIALDSESASQEELIVLDETGSSDSDNSDVRDETLQNQPSNNDDIQIIESENESPVAKASKSPVEITLEDEVELVKRKCTCNSGQRSGEADHGFIINTDLGVKITFLSSSSEKEYRSLFEAFMKSIETPNNKPDTKTAVAAEPEVFSDFCIDKTSSNGSASNTSVWKVPRYNEVQATLKLENNVVQELSPKVCSPKVTCFNCLGDHMIASCPKHKDRKRIAENREAYMIRCRSSQNKPTRYHADEDQRFSHIKPGRISENLRRALSLDRNEVPFFIYKMRLLGYPPGWLKEAEVTSSGLTVYDSDGKEVMVDNIEDGEVYESTAVRVQHDPNKLIDFPGFNVFLPYGFKDQCRKFGFPSIQDNQLKSNFGKTMKAPKIQPVKRKSTTPNSCSYKDKLQKIGETSTNLDDVEMEIEEIEVVESKVKESLPSTSSAVEQIIDSDDEDIRSRSPSLEELEQVKKNLLDVLSINVQACSSDTNGSLSQDSLTSSRDPDLDNNALTILKTLDKPSDESTCEIPEMQSLNTVERRTSLSASKSVELGSPSIITASSACLPPREKFSVGITEHIPYENLPGAIGQFDKLRSVLKTIRKIRS